MKNIAQFRKLLERRRFELIRRRSGADEERVSQNKNLLNLLDVVEDHELQRLDRAIERCMSGTYGKCESCSKEISENRLRHMPETTLCFDCGTRNFQPWPMSTV